MSVKPVDFQVMIPRTMDAAKVRSDEMQKHFAQLQQQADALKNKAENNMNQVYSKPQAQEARINEKQKEERNQQNEKKKKGENEEQSSDGKNGTKPGRTIRTSTIDIKI